MMSALLASLQQLGGGDQGAVGGAAVAGPGRCRSSTSMVTMTVAGMPPVSGTCPGRGVAGRRRLPSASCSRCPWVATVDGAGRVDPRLGQRVEQRFQLRHRLPR